MIIERTEKETVIRVPSTVDILGTQQIIDYIQYLEATPQSKAKQSEVDKLADEVNSGWWETNKDSYMK